MDIFLRLASQSDTISGKLDSISSLRRKYINRHPPGTHKIISNSLIMNNYYIESNIESKDQYKQK